MATATSTRTFIRRPSVPWERLAGPPPRWDRLLARLSARSLDARLARGCPPESDRRMTARAATLVSPAARLGLARQWAAVADRAGQPPAPSDPRVPLCRHRIRAAEPQATAMLDALVAPVPTAARGPAMLSWLLTDGTGPLYNRRWSGDLGRLLDEVTAQLQSMAVFP